MESKERFVAHYPVADVLRGLIQADTQNPPGNEADAVAYICSRLGYDERLFEKRIYEHGDNRESMVIRIRGESPKDAVVFMGHLDTVPAGSVTEWKYPPLEARVEEKKYMYGRGANDMKSGVAVMVMVLEYFLKSKVIPMHDIYFAFTADEECNCMGSVAIADSEYIKDAKYIFVPEPTGVKLGISEKGALWIELLANGRQAHGAIPEEGINPIDYLGDFIRRLKQELKEEDISVSTTIFESGSKNNVIPASARAVLDIRTQKEGHHELIRKQLDGLSYEMDEQYGIKIQYGVLTERIPLRMDKESALIQKMIEALKRRGLEADCIDIPFYTDLAMYLKHQKDKPDFLIFGPGNEKDMHTVNEKTDLERIRLVGDIYLEYLLNME